MCHSRNQIQSFLPYNDTYGLRAKLFNLKLDIVLLSDN